MSKSAEGIVEKAATYTGITRSLIETRIIVLALGIESHKEDIERNAQIVKNNPIDYPIKRWKYHVPPLNFLREKFKEKFEVEENSAKIKKILSEHKLDTFQTVRRVGTYTSDKQKVKFVIIKTVGKKDFKQALETEGLHVIYSGHSRYGRGACFHNYSGTARNHMHGDHWEGTVGIGTFTGNKSGLFRLGYQYVPVSLNDIKKHKYHFAPIPVEGGVPPRKRRHPFCRHPHARRALKKITLPLELRSFVWPSIYISSTNRYFGFVKSEKEDDRWRKNTYILLRAGWEKTINNPYDLGATNMKCKVFCHFGCSSFTHFWHIVRKKEYKGWKRPKPPTDKFVYVTTAPSEASLGTLWLCYLLSYDKKNNFKPWWKSLEYTKEMTNKKLKRIRAKYQVY